MPPQINYSVNISGLGGNINQQSPRTADSGLPIEIPLPVGHAAVLTTRSSNSVGTFTLGSPGGITTGMTVDVYWEGGVRYGVLVGTVSGTSVPVTLGSGDNLPIATTAVVITPQVTFDAAIYGNDLVFISVNQKFAQVGVTDNSHITFFDVTPLTIAELDLLPNTPQVFDIQGGSANPFAGNPIVSCAASNGSATYPATLQIYALQNV